MQSDNKDASLEALQEIRSIMDRSARFISLSGWSGIWAGSTALVGSYFAYQWMQQPDYKYARAALSEGSLSYFSPFIVHIILLALSVFIIAFAGGYYFTYKKAHSQGHKLWNNASRQMLLQLLFPLLSGGIFTMFFIYYGVAIFIAPACLIFYGLALISASRHTLADIRYLGMLEVVLGFINLFSPGHGLYFWAAGFGLLHILYGVIMRNKYDK